MSNKKNKPLRKIERGICGKPQNDIQVNAASPEALRDWLETQAKEHDLTTLLAHADDGVIWGEVHDSKLHLSHKAFPDISPPLRPLSLQQARLFGPEAELLVWRAGDGWKAHLLKDEEVEKGGAYFDEEQWLWGDRWENRDDLENPNAGFTLVSEGAEGRRHAVPLDYIANNTYFNPRTDGGEEAEEAPPPHHPLRLIVRHYLEYDDDGVVYIAKSRLVKLYKEKSDE